MASRSENVVVVGTGPDDELSLLEILDNVLHSGVVIRGSVVISLAGVDLVYVGISAVVTSVETALRVINRDAERRRT